MSFLRYLPPSQGPSTSTRPPSIAASSRTAPYDTFLFRSAALPYVRRSRAEFVRSVSHRAQIEGEQMDTLPAHGHLKNAV